jgi:outer membrane protein, adhesin transport system
LRTHPTEIALTKNKGQLMSYLINRPKIRAFNLALSTIAALAGVTSVKAQPVTTLKDVVEKAIVQNPEVKFRFHNLESAKKEREAAEGGWRPRVDLEAGGGSYRYKSPATPATQGYDGNRASVQLSQVLYDGYATLNEVRRLSFTEQSAFYEFMSTSHQIGLEATRAYIDVLRYRELVTLAEDNYATHKDVYEKILEKVTAGVGRRVDLEQASGRLALAESNWLTEVSNLHDVSARYQRLIGNTPPSTLKSIESLDGLTPKGIEFLNGAVLKHPDFLGAVSNIRAFRAEEKLKRSALAPTVELRARQGFANNQSGTLGNFRDSSVELVLNYNLYRGGSDLARAKQSASKLESAFELRDKACRDVWQTGQIAYNDTVRLDNQLKLLSIHELATSKARQAYQQQFDIGQRSLLDLLDTENELYQARRALNNAEYDLQLAKFRVLTTDGSLLNALGLQTAVSSAPSANPSGEADDELLRCSTDVIPTVSMARSSPRPTPVVVSEAIKVVPMPTSIPTPLPVVVKTDPPNLQCAQVTAMVQSWVTSWNSKDLAGYMNYYAKSFTPALGMNRNAWENLRKKRITKQGSIVATLKDVSIKSCEGKTAEVAFTQDYGSTDYKDMVEKVLALEWTGDSWKIARETVTKGRTF